MFYSKFYLRIDIFHVVTITHRPNMDLFFFPHLLFPNLYTTWNSLSLTLKATQQSIKLLHYSPIVGQMSYSKFCHGK
jgi:hypothetical protein